MGRGVTPEESSQVVPNDSTVLATLLKQEAGDGGLDQSVLVPLGVLGDEHPHRAVQILRHLVFHTHVDRHRIRRLVQLRLWLSTQPSRHSACSDVKKPERFRPNSPVLREALQTLTRETQTVSRITALSHPQSHRQEERGFSPSSRARPHWAEDPCQQACGKAVKNVVFGVESPFVHCC